MPSNKQSMSATSFYNQSVEEAVKELKSSVLQGLTETEARSRLEQSGYNEFLKKKGKSLLAKFLAQFESVMIIILLIAAVISGVTGYLEGEGFTDALIILIIVVVNAIIGVLQEERAERSLEALEKMSAPHCKVLRNGQVRVIESRELVPGDVVVLDTGDSVPADLRLIEAVNLKIQEAALTGESVPSEKETETIEEADVPLGDRHNLAFSSTNVVYGRGKGMVISTGMNTEVGRIAAMIQSTADQQTPLQQKLNKLGKHLGIGALAICALIFFIGLWHGHDWTNWERWMEMFMISVSLAVAAIPEGLPAVSTIVLAIGVQRLAKRNAIVRTLPAVETLGSTTVICSDKTGTLTQNKMTVVKLFTDKQLIDAACEAQSLSDDQKQLIRIAVFSNDAKLAEETDRYTTTGDPTETALIDLGMKFNFNKNLLEAEHPRVAEIPFDSERKLMTTVHRLNETEYAVYTKGGMDELLECCTKIRENGKEVALTEAHKQAIRENNTLLAKNALRVLAMACKITDKKSLAASKKHGADLQKLFEQELVFVGMMGMIDPPRPEVKAAVLTCRDAGIKPVMITGDHLLTAVAIAKELNIMHENDLALTGAEVEKMTDDELRRKVHHIAVYARVSPEHKVRIVKAFQAGGDIVAMTGDGVNDAPALKLADIGAAMGVVGTDVSKEAAGIVLTDDNFSTIVSAVEEGRRIYDNIMKAIEFLLSSNIGEILVLFVAVLANWAPPLLPIHILWVNLVTDSLPALALSVDPAGRGIMKRKPTDAKKPILNRKFSILLVLQGMMIGSLSLAAFQIGIHTTPVAEDTLDVARAMCFSVLAFSQLAHVFNVRSKKRFALGNFFSNKMLLGAVALSAGLMLMVLEIPYLHDLFRISHLTTMQWVYVAILSIAPIPIVDSVKFIVKLFEQSRLK